MKQKVYTPSYKVSRHGNGLYSVTLLGSSKFKQIIPSYIKRLENGSRAFYWVSDKAPLFPTLRDAVMHIVYGG